MKIVIAGAGTIGFNLAAKLSQEGHDLFLVDIHKNPLRIAEEMLDVKTIVGDATSVQVLRDADTKDADLLIAVTNVDAVNVLACQLASRLGAKKKIARIRDSGCFEDPSIMIPFDLGVDMVIYPEGEVSSEIWQLLQRPYATEVDTFFDGQMESVGLIITENSVLVGKTLSEVRELCSLDFSICGIVRDDEGIIPVNWEGTFQSEDKIFVVAQSGEMNNVVEELGFEFKKINNIFIFGGSAVGMDLAKRLDSTKVQARILEPDRNRSRELAYELKKVMVLHGEGTDSSLLEGEGIEEADVFVAVSDNEEVNLLSCILAKGKGALKSVALATKADYVPLISELGVDAVISKRLTTIDRIMQFVLQGEVVSVSGLSEEKLDAIEFRITNNTIVAGMELDSPEYAGSFPENALIGGIHLESGEALVPKSGFKLNVGDKVMVFASPRAIKEVEKIFV